MPLEDAVSNAVEIVFEEPVTDQAKTEQEPAPVKTEATEKVEDTASEEKPVDKTFTQAELDEILQKRIAKLERKHEKERIQSQTRQEVLAEVAKNTAPVEGEPKSEDFNDYGAYLKAQARWEVKNELAAQELEKQERSVREREMTEAQRRQERELDLMETGNNKYDDFDEVASKTGAHLKSKNLSFSPVMVNALIEADNAADIVHHLGTNLDEAERIARLPPYAQAKEIGKLEDRLSAKPPVKQSNAPAPISPVSSSKALTKTIEEMSVSEYEEHARKRGAPWTR